MKIYANTITIQYPDDLDQFIGKDLWVRVDAVGANMTSSLSRYVRVLKKTGRKYFKYICNAVLAPRIDNNELNIRHPYSMERLLQEWVYDMGDIQISSPISVYTTEDMVEMLGIDETEVI